MKLLTILIVLILVIQLVYSNEEELNQIQYDTNETKLKECSQYCEVMDKDSITKICEGRRPKDHNYASKMHQKCLLFKIYSQKGQDEKLKDQCDAICSIYSLEGDGMWPANSQKNDI